MRHVAVARCVYLTDWLRTRACTLRCCCYYYGMARTASTCCCLLTCAFSCAFPVLLYVPAVWHCADCCIWRLYHRRRTPKKKKKPIRRRGRDGSAPNVMRILLHMFGLAMVPAFATLYPLFAGILTSHAASARFGVLGGCAIRARRCSGVAPVHSLTFPAVNAVQHEHWFVFLGSATCLLAGGFMPGLLSSLPAPSGISLIAFRVACAYDLWFTRRTCPASVALPGPALCVPQHYANLSGISQASTTCDLADAVLSASACHRTIWRASVLAERVQAAVCCGGRHAAPFCHMKLAGFLPGVERSPPNYGRAILAFSVVLPSLDGFFGRLCGSVGRRGAAFALRCTACGTLPPLPRIYAPLFCAAVCAGRRLSPLRVWRRLPFVYYTCAAFAALYLSVPCVVSEHGATSVGSKPILPFSWLEEPTADSALC